MSELSQWVSSWLGKALGEAHQLHESIDVAQSEEASCSGGPAVRYRGLRPGIGHRNML